LTASVTVEISGELELSVEKRMAQLTGFISASASNVLIGIGLLLLVRLVALVVYRLYLSPISKFPGPWLAASTLWYEFYYDVIKRGSYTWEIGEMHKKYGMNHVLLSRTWS
jgi:hypothetical protein